MYSSLLPLSWLELESCFEPLNWRIRQDVSQLHLTVHLLCAAPGAHPVSFPFPELALEQRSDMFLLEKKQRSGSRLSEMASTWFGQKEDWTILNLENLAHLRPSTCCCLHASKCHMWHCCCQAKGANWCSLECTQLRIWGPICRCIFQAKIWKFEERITGQNIIPLKGKWLPNEAQFRLNAIHFSEVENLRIITCNRVFIWNTFNHFCGSSQFQGAPSPQKRTLFNIYKKFWSAFLCVCALCALCVCVHCAHAMPACGMTWASYRWNTLPQTQHDASILILQGRLCFCYH